MAKTLITLAVLILMVSFGYLLHRDYDASPLLGLWDTGRYTQAGLPQPKTVQPRPLDSVLHLTVEAADITSTQETLGQLFDHYGLGDSLLAATIRRSGLGDPGPEVPVASLRAWRLRTGMQLLIPLQAGGGAVGQSSGQNSSPQ